MLSAFGQAPFTSRSGHPAHNVWEINSIAGKQFNQRLIAMLDVLGFSSQIAGTADLGPIAEKYAQIILDAKRRAFTQNVAPGGSNQAISNFAVGEFVFDNVVLVSEETSPTSVGNFIFSLLLIMEAFFSARFPLRGAISIGNYYSNDETGVFLSDTFKRLSTIGQHQEWTGCIVLPEAEGLVIESLFGSGTLFPDRSQPVVPYPVPRKKDAGVLGELFCLN